MEPYYTPKKSFAPFKPYMGKTAQIEKAVQRKEAGIKHYTDMKSASIAASSCFNGALELVNILVDKGRIAINPTAEDPMKEYWEWHDRFFYETLERFNEKQEEGKQEWLGNTGSQPGTGRTLTPADFSAKPNVSATLKRQLGLMPEDEKTINIDE